MDRYEFDIKIEQIKKLMKKKDYATAVKIADGIEWRKVKENQLLIMAADVYEVAGKYDEAREVLLMAYEKTGLGRQLAYRICRLSVKRSDFTEAEEFYDEFVQNSPRDAGRYILQYEMAKGKGEPIEKQIEILETFIEDDMDDRWAYELAKLYHRAHLSEKCVELCDTIILWFADGKYVEKALELKQLYVPLSENQKLKYEVQKTKKEAPSVKVEESVAEEVEISAEKVEDSVEETSGDMEVETVEKNIEETVKDDDILDTVHEMDIDVNSIHVKDYSVNNKYDTMNLQLELAKSVSSLVDNTIEIFKPNAPKTKEEEEIIDDQITGQMNLEEVLAMFEAGEFNSKDEEKTEETEQVENAMATEDDVEEVEDILNEEIYDEEYEAEDYDDSVKGYEIEEDDETSQLAAIIANEIAAEIQADVDEEIFDEQRENDEFIDEMFDSIDGFESFNEICEGEIEEYEEEVSEYEVGEYEEEAFEDEVEEYEEEASEDTIEEDSEAAEYEEEESDEFMVNLKEGVGAILDEEDKETVKEKEVEQQSGEKQADIAKRELKNFVSKFTGVQGLDKQILKVMQSVLKTDMEPVKLIFVKGEVKSGKTTLAIDVIKLVNKIIQRREQKIAKIKGVSLNDKSIDSLIKVLSGSDVLIERVSDVKPEVFVEFIDKLKAEGRPRVVIFEDEKTLADAFLKSVPDEYRSFDNLIDIKMNKIKDWTKIAEDYAKKKGYTIDEMGILALSAKIDQLRAITLVVHKNHVEQLIDGAIANANKFTFRNIMNKFKKSKEEEYKVLTEKNFAD